MAYNDYQGGKPERRIGNMKMTTAFIIFVVGVIVGVIGLCTALKVIFYIGLVVVILAGLGVIWAVFAVRRDIRNDDDNAPRYPD